jgi:putative ABC transport system permease protein
MIAKLWMAGLRANAGRTLLAAAGIALGVALGTAVHIINQSAIGEMQQATRALSGDADLSIRGGKSTASGISESALESVLADNRVIIASPVIEASIPLDQKRSIKFIGLDIFRAPYLQPGFAVEPFEGGDRLAALRGDHVFINRAAKALLPDANARELNLTIRGEPRRLVIAGTIDLPQFREPLAVIDIAGAQTLFGLAGTLTRIDLRLTPGADTQAAAASLIAAMPAGVTVATPAQVDRQSAAISRAYRINLTVLSLVALFTGGFLVFATQSLSVMRRRAELALYRTLGVTRRELMRTLLGEGAVLGLISGVAGALGGVAIASLALYKFGGDLGSGFFASTTLSPRIDALAVAGFVALGVFAGVAGAWLPARAATREPAARGLKGQDGDGTRAALPPVWAGLALLGAGGVLLLLPPFDDVPWTAYAAIAALLLGVLSLAPAASAWLLGSIPPSRQWIRRLSMQHIEKSPGPAAAGITGVIASFSLMIAMLIMVVSFRTSLEQWLNGVLDADLYVRHGTGEARTLNPSTGGAFRAINGVKRADFLRYRSIVLDTAKPELPAVTLIARPIRADVLKALSVQQSASLPANSAQPKVWISEAVADLYGYAPGNTITLPLDGRAHQVVVAGIWRDYARSFGAIVVDREDFLRWTNDMKINDISLALDSPHDKARVINAIRAMPGGEQIEIADAAEIRALSLSVFDRSFAVTYALEIAAIFVGLAGISATFSAQAWSRRREFGMLRHLGATRREIGKLLASEGALLGAFGAAIGLALGLVIALILIFVVNRQSFRWSMELHVPWITMSLLALALIALTALSATVSGRLAMSRQAVLAVKDDQ